MTDPEQPQPKEPVLNAGVIAGTITGLVTTVGMTLVGTGWLTQGQVTAASRITQALVFAAATIIAALTPYIAAWRARRKVTPVAAPRDNAGRALVPVEEYGRHAAPVDDRSASMGPDLPVEPDDELVTWARGLNDTQEIPSVTDIHGHPTRKLGKRPTDPNRPVLRMGAHFTAAAFTAPSSVDYASRVPSWILGGNDKFGTCGPTSVANLVLLVSTLLADAPVRFTDDEIFDLYRRSGNPDFNPATGAGDRGVDMTVMLAELVKNGIGSGARNVKAVAFGSVDAHDTAKLWAAGALFGGVLWGADLEVAQQTQTNAGLWDYQRSGTWGGHAILSAPAYTDQPGTLADRTKLVTWQELIAASDTFIARQVSECYVVLFPWHLGDKRIYQALDMQGVADEYQQLTGRPFPAPVQPPAPQPVPAPPAPAPGPAPAIPADWVTWAKHTLALKEQSRATVTVAREIIAAAGQ